MSSSPKITLDLYPRSANADPQSSTDFISSHGGGGGGLDSSALAALTLNTEPSWVCSCCYNSNQGGLAKCTVCGVRKPQGSLETPTTPAADPFHFIESIPTNTAIDTPSTNEQPGIACPACTFHNDPFMIHCEMCGTQLQDQDSMAFMLHRQQQHQRSISQLPSTLSQPSTSLSTTPNSLDMTATGKLSAPGKFMAGMSNFYNGSKPTVEDANSVKLSFRAGGSGSFQTLLKSAVGNKAWEVNPIARGNFSSHGHYFDSADEIAD